MPELQSSAARVAIPRLYLPVKYKLVLALAGAFGWCGFSAWLALPWITDLAELVGPFWAWAIIGGVALLPGLASAFVLAGLLLDSRPRYLEATQLGQLPPLSILVAAYNEARNIDDTLTSLTCQEYPAEIEILVIDDGSTDATADRVRDFQARVSYDPARFRVRLIQAQRNGGKARALNLGLAQVRHDLVVTVDGDSYLYEHALRNIAANLVHGPPRTAAVAGTVLARNSRRNLIARLQEWDYFHGIAIVKRTQSLFQGTLVAQGAFSIYRREALVEVGGWPDTVGEDIVLTWGLLEEGYRIGYAENAFVFTNVPETLGAYYRQRKRWARGLIEAIKAYPRILTRPRLNTPFIYMNLMFPYIDFAYLCFFLPGVLLAVLFGFYAIAGPMTLILLPLALVSNVVMYVKQRRIFAENGLKVRRNYLGWMLYAVTYQLLLSPASLAGYFTEVLGARKKW